MSHGGVGAGGWAHIVSIYHSHVTKFSPHRETLLTSTEHVALPILYIIGACFPRPALAQRASLRGFAILDNRNVLSGIVLVGNRSLIKK